MRDSFLAIADYLIYLSSVARSREKPCKKRLLIVRKDHIGDLLLFYPTLRAYREHFADHEIDFVATSTSRDLFPLFKKHVDRVIEFDAKGYKRLGYRIAFIHTLYRRSYDTVLYPAFSREVAGDRFVRAARAKTNIGFKGDSFNSPSAAYEHLYTTLLQDSDIPALDIDKNAYFAKKVCGSAPTLAFPTIEETELTPYDGLPTTYCVIFPGAAKAYKRWPTERYARICEEIIKTGITPVICGSKGESILAESIGSHLPKGAWINICGKTSLLELGFVLRKSLFYFGSDTGALHLAVAVGTPTICVMGLGTFDRFFPYGDKGKNIAIYDLSLPCKNDAWACAKGNGEKPAPCIESISVEQALTALQPFFQPLP